MADWSGRDAPPGVTEDEGLYLAVFQHAADAVLILDEHRRVVEANHAAGVLFGLSAVALRGRSLDSLVTDGEQLEAAWTELVALGETTREHRVISEAGATRAVECRYRAHVRPGRHLWAARDIVDRRLLEEHLAQSGKLESMARLAGGVSHDFNNLLTTILGYVELMLSHAGPNDPNREDLLEIQNAGQRASELTQQLLALSREQGAVAATDPTEAPQLRQSHGVAAVDGEPGGGTTSAMQVHAVAAPQPHEASAALQDGPEAGRETILLVDDEDGVRVVVSAMLRRQGYQVLEAATARGAEEIFDRHARDIDLLLTDVVMPEMNGPTLAERLIARRAELRVLFISGYSDVPVPLDSGNPNVGFLGKPFQASALAERVREMLARPLVDEG